MKKVLLVVDYQKDFVDGALGFPGAETLEAPICRRIEAARADGWDVWFTFDTHTEDYLSTQEGRKLPVPHCIKDSDGWKLYGGVAQQQREDDDEYEYEVFSASDCRWHICCSFSS